MKKIIIIIIMVSVVLVGMIYLVNQRDQQLVESAEAYEACVLAETGMTPLAYYAEQGEMLECPPQN